MFQQFLSGSPLILWPLLAFGLFFTSFLAVCVVLVVGAVRKKSFDHVSRLPLEDDADAAVKGGAR